jgi:hypothetical protein
VSLLGTIGSGIANLLPPGISGLANLAVKGVDDYFTGPSVPVNNQGPERKASLVDGPSAAPVIGGMKVHTSKLGKMPGLTSHSSR